MEDFCCFVVCFGILYLFYDFLKEGFGGYGGVRWIQRGPDYHLGAEVQSFRLKFE
jgi:hypothetical protein